MDSILRLPLMVLLVCQAWGADGDLLDRIVAAQASNTTAVGVFDRSIRQAAFPDMAPQRYRVDLWVDAPDKYHLRFHQPDDDPGVFTAFVGDGERRWKVEVWDPDEPADIIEKKAGDGDAMSRIKDLVPLRREALERDFTLTAVPQDDAGARLLLEPIDAELREHIERIEVGFDAALEVSEVLIRMTEGNLETWTTRSIEHPEEIDPSHFVVE